MVLPSLLARRGLIEPVLPDVSDVPLHRDEHLTPAEGPVLLAGQREVQLLARGQVESAWRIQSVLQRRSGSDWMKNTLAN